jgi:protocatechuate 3,4-dioxygenase beta subunit
MRMLSWRTWLVACLLAVVSAPAWPQGARGGAPGAVSEPNGQRVPTRDRRPSEQVAGTGSISGRVVSSDGSPLRRTQVQLAGAGVTGRTTLTDSDGRYSFTALPPGRYTLRVFRGGYLNIAYGQRTPTDAAQPLELTDGQSASGIDIVMPRGGAIAGRVVDEFGEPVLQAQIQALRYQYQPSGERLLQPGGAAAVTDDLGQFRLYGLNPGEYVVSATSRNQFLPTDRLGGDLLAFGDHAQEGYAPTYYPGTTNAAEAQPVLLGVGQELLVQFQLVPSRLAQVSGTVVDSQGRPVSGSPVTLRPSATVVFAPNRPANTTADGAFTITNVAPGDYVLEVRPRPQPANPGGGPQRGNPNTAPAPEVEFGSVPLTVAGDISGLHIVTGQGATIAGRVVFEGTPPSGGLRIRVVAQVADPQRSIGLPGPRNAQEEGLVGSDGTFELTRITGPIFLRVQLTDGRGGPAPTQTINFMTKSVIVDGVDVADTPFDPTRRGRTTNVTLVLTDKVTDIGGVVTDNRGTPLESSVVLIVPENLPAGLSPSRFQRILQSDREGKFSVRGMPPGRYVAIAANSIDAGHQYDPETAQRVRQRGHAFTVREGEKITLALNLTTDF